VGWVSPHPKKLKQLRSYSSSPNGCINSTVLCKWLIKLINGQDLMFPRRWLWRLLSSGKWRRIIWCIGTWLNRIVSSICNSGDLKLLIFNISAIHLSEVDRASLFTLSLSLSLSLSLWLYSPLDLGRSFSFLILYTVCRTPCMGDQPVTRPLPTHRTTQTQNKCKRASMPRVGFEPTIPPFKRVKTVDDLDLAATVIGRRCHWKIEVHIVPWKVS
jgi:hypothetical protein